MNWFVSGKAYEKIKKQRDILKKENESLKKVSKEERNESTKMITNLKNALDSGAKERDREKKEYEKTIEMLRRENDILHTHFKLDEKPSQEIITAVRIDKRVHDLELENLELRTKFEYMYMILDSYAKRVSNTASFANYINGAQFRSP